MKSCSYCGSNYHPSFKCFLKPKKGIERKTELTNKPSAKRSAEAPIYDANKKEYLSRHDVCEFPDCESTILTLHHGAGRTGSYYTDMNFFKALCPDHHVWCENHPEEAKLIGMSFDRL